MNARRGAWLRWTLAGATLALLVIVARRIEWARTLAAVHQARPSLLAAAVGANLASLAVKGFRWGWLLEGAGASGRSAAVRATFAAAALNNVVIANGGDAVRVAALARVTQTSSARVLAALAVDRFTDLAIYGALVAVAAAAIPMPAALARWRGAGLAIVVLTIIIGVAAGLRPAGEVTTTHAERARPRDRVRRYIVQILHSSRAIAAPNTLAVALVLACVAWAGQWATFHLAALAIDFRITATESLLALLVVNASFAIRLTPGNVGVFQLLYTLACNAVGLDADRAVAAAFLIQLIQYIPVTLVGLALAPWLVGSASVHRAGRWDVPS